MPACIKEEGFFKALQWIFPVQAGIVVAMLVGENLFSYEDYTTMLFYSYCSRISCSWQKMADGIGIGHLIGSIGTFCVVGLGLQLAIFVRESQIEKQQTARVWSVSFNNNNGVRISSADSNSNISMTSNSTSRVLWKHHRNVISPYASLVSFLVCQVYALVIIYLFLEIGPLGPAVIFQFLHFIIFCIFFFVLSLIETAFSPTLLDSLIPWRKRKYQAATV